MSYFDTGERIRDIRKERGLNQDQLAELASLNRVTIAKYESGRVEPGAHALSRIADALDVSADVLLGRTDEVRPAPEPPQTEEARIFLRGIDKLPQEDRERAVNILKAAFADYFDKPEDKMA